MATVWWSTCQTQRRKHSYHRKSRFWNRC